MNLRDRREPGLPGDNGSNGSGAYTGIGWSRGRVAPLPEGKMDSPRVGRSGVPGPFIQESSIES